MKILLAFFFLFCFSARAEHCGVVDPLSGEFTATTTDQILLARDDFRKGFLFVNKGLVTVYLKYNSAQSGTQGIEIPAGGNFEPLVTPQDEIHIRAASGTSAVYKSVCH